MWFRSRGQSLVEFALVMPILIVFVFGVIDFSYYIFTYSELENATRRASEFAAKAAPSPSNTACMNLARADAVKNFVLTDASPSKLTFTFSYPNGRTLYEPAVVSTTYSGTFLTPIARSAFGNNFTFNFSSKRTILGTRPVFDSNNIAINCN